MTGRYAPLFPVLIRAEGPRCPVLRHRRDRITLQCVRRVHGPDVRHLMDVRDADSILDVGEYRS